jgi:hypothetical protein
MAADGEGAGQRAGQRRTGQSLGPAKDRGLDAESPPLVQEIMTRIQRAQLAKLRPAWRP